MSDETNEATVAPDPKPAENPPPSDNKPAKTEGVIPLQMHEEKVQSLHRDLSKERAELKRLREENEALKSENGTFKLNQKKSEAFDVALQSLGEDFEIPSENIPKVKGLLAKLPDSETLQEEVAGLLDLVKAPKAKQSFGSPFTGGVPTNPSEPAKFVPGQKLTPWEVGQLSPDQHAAYIKSLQTR